MHADGKGVYLGMALVDILMPVRDAQPWLVASLRSLRRQTFAEWRLLAVDDGSLDGSIRVLREAGRRDRRIRVLSGPRRGVASALNAALRASDAPFLVRMDADDLSSPRRLELLIAAARESPWVGVVGSRVRLFPRALVSFNMERYIRWQNSLLTPEHLRRERFVESTLTHATALFRREPLIRAEGWCEGPFPEDLDLWLRLHGKGIPFLKRPEILYLWRERPERETRVSPRCSADAFHRCRLAHLSNELRQRGAASLAVIGPERARVRWADSLAALGFSVRSLAWSPGKPPPVSPESGVFTIACFGIHKARQRARQSLDAAGWLEEKQYLFVG